jgi:hypothetical protein
MNPSSTGTRRDSWGFAFLEIDMATSDHVVRAQARALIRVLIEYKLDREWGGVPAIWRDLEDFGRSGTADSLQKIGRNHGGTAAAAFCAGVKNRVPNAALYLALVCFARSSPAYRFLDPSRWLALMFAFRDSETVANSDMQGELLEKLEAAFEAECGSGA